MKLLRFFPLLTLPAIVYGSLLAWPGPIAPRLAEPILSIVLASGDTWSPTLGAALIMLSALCLFVEIVRSATPDKAAIGENISTALVFSVCFGLFLLAPGFGTTEFFLIVLLLLLDFLADATIMVFTSRRSVQYSRN